MTKRVAQAPLAELKFVPAQSHEHCRKRQCETHTEACRVAGACGIKAHAETATGAAIVCARTMALLGAFQSPKTQARTDTRLARRQADARSDSYGSSKRDVHEARSCTARAFDSSKFREYGSRLADAQHFTFAGHAQLISLGQVMAPICRSHRRARRTFRHEDPRRPRRERWPKSASIDSISAAIRSRLHQPVGGVGQCALWVKNTRAVRRVSRHPRRLRFKRGFDSLKIAGRICCGLGP